MKFHTYFVVLLIFLKKANADYIQCYVCEDCEENEGELVSCALLGELQLIDPIVQTTAETAALISSTQMTTTTIINENTTSANFENLTSTTTAVSSANFENVTSTIIAVQENLTTVSIPNAIDSMESYEDMEWERESAESPIYNEPDRETTNRTSGEKEILVANATAITTNETAETTDDESELAEPVNLTTTLQENTFTNTTDVLGLNATANETFLNSTTFVTTPNATSAAAPGSESFENITLAVETTDVGPLNTSVNVNSTSMATEVLELNGTENLISAELNGTIQINTTDLNFGGDTTTVNNTNLSSDNVTSTEILILENEANSGNGTITTTPILANETTSSLGLNGTIQNNTITVLENGTSSSMEINGTAGLTAGTSLLENGTASSVGLNGTTALTSGNVTTTESMTSSVAFNGTTEVNTTAISSGNITTETQILESTIGINGTAQEISSAVDSGNLTTTGNSTLGSDFMNSTSILEQDNFTITEIMQLAENLNGTLQNITTATLLTNLTATITGNETSDAIELNGTSESQTNATTTSTNANATSTVNNAPNEAIISEEYSDEDDGNNYADSDEEFRKRSKTYRGKLGATQETTINGIQLSKPFLVKQTPTDFLLNKYSKLRHVAGLKQVNITYKCYTVRVKGENKVQINKGCIAVPAERTACELLGTKYGEDALQDCQVCLEGKCNSRSSSNDLKFSTPSVILTIVSAWLLS
ncbi:mucin-19-like [Bactrocera neohumeralis]|uniref:mucin-19-like n=1 Tax=Bactrocera neohumeralis TaxID=98809 RepID=UPI0021651FE7|nr:mucin-19-like [Bactrocera neohumeralis]